MADSEPIQMARPLDRRPGIIQRVRRSAAGPILALGVGTGATAAAVVATADHGAAIYNKADSDANQALDRLDEVLQERYAYAGQVELSPDAPLWMVNENQELISLDRNQLSANGVPFAGQERILVNYPIFKNRIVLKEESRSVAMYAFNAAIDGKRVQILVNLISTEHIGPHAQVPIKTEKDGTKYIETDNGAVTEEMMGTVSFPKEAPPSVS